MPRVEVVEALPRRQKAVPLELPPGATLKDALLAAGFDATRPAGIFGERAPPQTRLKEGDRVEVYRPLRMDPKEARRARAAKKPARRR